MLLPVAYLLSLTGRLELVWWSFPIAELVSLTLSAIFLRRTLRAAGERLSQNKNRRRRPVDGVSLLYSALTAPDRGCSDRW